MASSELCMLMQRLEMMRVMLRMLSRMRMLSMLRSAAASLWPTGDRCALCSIMHSINFPKHLRSTRDAVKGKHSCLGKGQASMFSAQSDGTVGID